MARNLHLCNPWDEFIPWGRPLESLQRLHKFPEFWCCSSFVDQINHRWGMELDNARFIDSKIRWRYSMRRKSIIRGLVRRWSDRLWVKLCVLLLHFLCCIDIDAHDQSFCGFCFIGLHTSLQRFDKLSLDWWFLLPNLTVGRIWPRRTRFDKT